MATEIAAEMTASVWKVLVSEGDVLDEGAEIAILESMKMEIPVVSETAGTVTSLRVEEGGSVEEGEIIAVIE